MGAGHLRVTENDKELSLRRLPHEDVARIVGKKMDKFAARERGMLAPQL